MGMWKVAALAAALGGAVSMADAQTIGLREPDMMAELLRVEGFEATVDKVKADENPVISAVDDGLNFGVYFSNCEKTKDCQSVELYASFQKHKIDQARINKWNRDMRFTRAYLLDNGDAGLSMDINVEPGGMERKLFVDNLAIWSSLLGQFADLAFPPDPAKETKSAK